MRNARLYITAVVAAITVGIPVGLLIGFYWFNGNGEAGPGTVATTSTVADITSFEECAARGFPVMESYPRRCIADGREFVEYIGDTGTVEPSGTGGDGGFEELAPDLRLKTPHSHETVSFPLTVEGEAAGWYFEGEFPIQLRDSDGNILADSYATAQGDWMTADFVPFMAIIEASPGTQNLSLLLVFSKADPRGLGPEHSVSVPLTLGG